MSLGLNSDSELENILNISLNECITQKYETNDILLAKSLYLYMSDLFKQVIIYNIPNKQVTKCIGCFSESGNVLNICKCGLENLCYTCLLIKYTPIIGSTINKNKINVVVDNKISKQYIIDILKTCVHCKYCNIPGNFLNVLNDPNMLLDTMVAEHFMCETEYLNLENKIMIDIFPNLKFSDFVKNMGTDPMFRNYGLTLDHGDNTIIFKLNDDSIVNILNGYNPTQKNINCIKCDINICVSTIFNTIYYKCIEFILKYKTNKNMIDKWNKYCDKLNKLLMIYNRDNITNMDYYTTVTLAYDISGIKL